MANHLFQFILPVTSDYPADFGKSVFPSSAPWVQLECMDQAGEDCHVIRPFIQGVQSRPTQATLKIKLN